MQLSAGFKPEKETIGSPYVRKQAIPAPPPTASPSLSKLLTDPCKELV